METMRCEVAVIGAGVNGTSIAYELCRRGKDVLLIDRKVMGSGASGACDDMILLQSKKPGILLEMAFASLERFKALKDELPCDIEFDTRGGTILIEDDEHLAVMEDFVAKQRACGLDVEIIDTARLRELQPLVARDIIASTYSPADSQVNPMLLMKGFAMGGMKLGLRYRSRVWPVGIDRRGEGWALELSDGSRVEAETVVDAAGAWANELTAMIGFQVPITPRKGQVVVTESLPPIGATNVWSAQYIVSKLKPQAAPASGAEAAAKKPADRFGLGFAFTGTHSGNYLIGSTRENAGYDTTTDPEALGLITRQVQRFFPALSRINFIRSFAGLRPSTPDGMPILGEVPGAPRFFVAAGHEGDGIALSPVTGQVMADLICGGTPAFPMDAFAPGRFAAAPLGAAPGAAR